MEQYGIVKDKTHIINYSIIAGWTPATIGQHGFEAEVILLSALIHPLVKTGGGLRNSKSKSNSCVHQRTCGVAAVAEHIDHKSELADSLYCRYSTGCSDKHFDQSNVIATTYATQLAEELINHTAGPVVFFAAIAVGYDSATIAVSRNNCGEIVVYHTELIPQRVKRIQTE